jgi:hypothetical protein
MINRDHATRIGSYGGCGKFGVPSTTLCANCENFNNTKHRFQTSTEIPPTLFDASVDFDIALNRASPLEMEAHHNG